MFDFGSIMGSGSTTPQVPRAGNEYILEWGPAFKTLATLGLYVRPWILVDYWEGAKSVGRFEGDFFDPVKWRPEYPNPAFDNMTPDDAFWAARLVAKFSDEAIRAVVAKARYSEPGAAEHITVHVNQAARQGAACVVDRRQSARQRAAQLGRHADVRERRCRCGHREASAVVSATPWSRFDNATGAATPAIEGGIVAGTSGRVDRPHQHRDAEAVARCGIPQSERPHDPSGLSGVVQPRHVHLPPQRTQWETVGLDRTGTSVVQK